MGQPWAHGLAPPAAYPRGGGVGEETCAHAVCVLPLSLKRARPPPLACHIGRLARARQCRPKRQTWGQALLLRPPLARLWRQEQTASRRQRWSAPTRMRLQRAWRQQSRQRSSRQRAALTTCGAGHRRRLLLGQRVGNWATLGPGPPRNPPLLLPGMRRLVRRGARPAPQLLLQQQQQVKSALPPPTPGRGPLAPS